MRGANTLSNSPIGKCGMSCKACRLYVLSKCKGCLSAEFQKMNCTLYKCATTRKIDSCGNCQDFPCLEHYGENQVFSKRKLLDWKKREIKPN